MAGFFKKRGTEKALEEAKLLEKEPEPIPTRQDEAELVEDTVSLSEKLKKLLKPEWFVKDVHRPCEKCKKAKPARKRIRAKPVRNASKKKAAAGAAGKKKK